MHRHDLKRFVDLVMSADKPKGIVDPWKRVDPLRPTPRAPPKEKKNIEDRDLDADLAEAGTYTLRSKHVCFGVSHVRIQSGKDAVDVLADCIYELFQDKALRHELTSVGIGVETKAGTYNRPDNENQASWIKGEHARLWFNRVPLDHGLLALSKILRKPAALKTIQRWGVTPMRAT